MCEDWGRDTNEKYSISISLGACPYNADDEGELQDFLDKADALLYQEKQQKHSPHELKL